MTIYTVHAPLERTGEPDTLRLVFVKEGFCWPALLVPLPWLLYRRIWIGAALSLLLAVLFVLLRQIELLPLGIGLALLWRVTLGVFGNDLRRWKLAATGFAWRGVVEAGSQQDAEIRYFHGADADALSPPSAREQPALKPIVRPASIIGLFPISEQAR